jgi:hypothetical protein
MLITEPGTMLFCAAAIDCALIVPGTPITEPVPVDNAVLAFVTK